MPNRLAGETSPYLRQHADNPVDWYPWGEEALALARREDRPILLSIGYSACHWCHVMAHESFEDAETAAAMNRFFVNIKVDREERPDLDHIYQTAHQMLAQRAGGWPLTMFLTPGGVPFFGGTYFPPSPRYGLPGFVALLERVAVAWREQREAIEGQNRSLLSALARTLPQPTGAAAEFSATPIVTARRQLRAQFDSRWGGFGGAPKFPHPGDLALLLASPEAQQRDMALLSLRRMAEGGIFDQLGGGFCRYSVDSQWGIPHFEKMLYDNGPLLGLYADACLMTGEPLFRRVAEMTAGWVLREMLAPEGGFRSALDADSEGEEGRYYVWSRDELRSLLDGDEYAVFASAYGLDGPPNFEGKSWHLRLRSPLPAGETFDSACAKALAARERRIRPACDDKILAGWNGLLIEGLLRAGRRLQCSPWIGAAQEALDFVRETLWREGRLLATCKDGRARLNAYLDDHAFLLAACLESLQAEFRRVDFDFAVTLADALLACFEDPDAGGFFFTSHEHEQLLHRAKIAHDGATPAGGAVAARALQRLSSLTGERRYDDAARRALALHYPELQSAPAGAAAWLRALDERLHPSPLVVLRGEGPELDAWRHRFAARSPDDVMFLCLPQGIANLPLNIDKPTADAVNAWVCEGVSCLPAMDCPEALEAWFARR